MAFGVGISILSCESGKYFSQKVLPYLNKYLETENLENTSLIKSQEQKFRNTEIKSNILESIRGKDVYIFQDVSNTQSGYSVNDNVLALKTLINSAKRADAARINVVIPTFPYARQDKPFGREGITAKMFAQELELLDVDTVITLDLHNPAIIGFFTKAVVENLKGFRNLIKYVKENIDISNLVVSSPDLGGIKRAELFATEIKSRLVTIYKERNYEKIDAIDKMYVIGDVKDKDVLLVDDMVDTAGTIYNACKLLKENGARKIYVICSLPFLNGKATERLSELYENNQLTNLIGTNCVYHSKEYLETNPWFKIIDIEKYFAKVIFNLHTAKSISKLLTDFKE